MENESCPHNGKAPSSLLSNLHGSQVGAGRHRCVVCAYSIGYEEGIRVSAGPQGEIEECQEGSWAPLSILVELPEGQGGSGRHKCAICAFRFGMEAGRHAAGHWTVEETEHLAHGSVGGDFIPDEEGRLVWRQHVAFERSRRNRERAIKLHGTVCAACGFDFDKFYGLEHARGYIEIHHVRSITEQAGRRVEPEKDLVPLCSNCHSMAHRSGHRILSVAELQALIIQAERR